MAFDYFYGAQSQQFAFYRIPKVLFTDNRFQNISTEGKVLYGLLLDRVSLSMENGWIDDEGRVYIIFTLTTIRQHPNYKLTADYDKRNYFDVVKFLSYNLILKADDEYQVIDVTE